MNVSDLKKALAALPKHVDDYQVSFVARVEPLSNGITREDHPLCDSVLLDDSSKELLVMHSEQHKKLIEICSTNNALPKPS